ncbi:FliM/FliN family flagellar motor switch protein [Aestuariivirga litoralis]|uniref:FliM/FliN family flagellar motor switch protein n=1 Tax=Aestuariivirga litoralis TaxID=2650924 RepID=UPI0018C810A1|nr:FliM/FliN family flagellar motor switch protein [Aestuariivirga litoralis]MBG1233202.1 hypothetical protein [Aestuariivirga litoralis]
MTPELDQIETQNAGQEPFAAASPMGMDAPAGLGMVEASVGQASAATPFTGMAASFAKVPVTVQVMLGTARIPLSELLSLKAGSLLGLDQKLGEPVTVIVNGCKVATGELFVLEGEDEKLAVKIKEVVSSPAGM